MREARDLLGRAVAHAQRLERVALHAEFLEEPAPRREAVVRLHVLLGVAREREAAPLVEAVDQHLHFERREVLHLVDRDVAVAQGALAAAQRPDAQLPGAQQQRVVLGVELRLDFCVALEPREQLLVAAPAVVGELIERRRSVGAGRAPLCALAKRGKRRWPSPHAAPVVGRVPATWRADAPSSAGRASGAARRGRVHAAPGGRSSGGVAGRAPSRGR